MVHGDIRPLYITYDGYEFKLADRLGDPSSPNQVQINNINNERSLYMSNVLYEKLTKYIDNPVGTLKVRHNPYKSDIFSLGLVIVEAGNLTSVQDIYNKREPFKINEANLDSHVKRFAEKYYDSKDKELSKFIERITVRSESAKPTFKVIAEEIRQAEEKKVAVEVEEVHRRALIQNEQKEQMESQKPQVEVVVKTETKTRSEVPVRKAVDVEATKVVPVQQSPERKFYTDSNNQLRRSEGEFSQNLNNQVRPDSARKQESSINRVQSPVSVGKKIPTQNPSQNLASTEAPDLKKNTFVGADGKVMAAFVKYIDAKGNVSYKPNPNAATTGNTNTTTTTTNVTNTPSNVLRQGANITGAIRTLSSQNPNTNVTTGTTILPPQAKPVNPLNTAVSGSIIKPQGTSTTVTNMTASPLQRPPSVNAQSYGASTSNTNVNKPASTTFGISNSGSILQSTSNPVLNRVGGGQYVSNNPSNTNTIKPYVSNTGGHSHVAQVSSNPGTIRPAGQTYSTAQGYTHTNVSQTPYTGAITQNTTKVAGVQGGQSHIVADRHSHVTGGHSHVTGGQSHVQGGHSHNVLNRVGSYVQGTTSNTHTGAHTHTVPARTVSGGHANYVSGGNVLGST